MARAALNLSRAEFSKLTGVNHVTLSAFENGREVTARTIRKIRQACEAKGVQFVSDRFVGTGVYIARTNLIPETRREELDDYPSD